MWKSNEWTDESGCRIWLATSRPVEAQLYFTAELHLKMIVIGKAHDGDIHKNWLYDHSLSDHEHTKDLQVKEQVAVFFTQSR